MQITSRNEERRRINRYRVSLFFCKVKVSAARNIAIRIAYLDIERRCRLCGTFVFKALTHIRPRADIACFIVCSEVNFYRSGFVVICTLARRVESRRNIRKVRIRVEFIYKIVFRRSVIINTEFIIYRIVPTCRFYWVVVFVPRADTDHPGMFGFPPGDGFCQHFVVFRHENSRHKRYCCADCQEHCQNLLQKMFSEHFLFSFL